MASDVIFLTWFLFLCCWDLREVSSLSLDFHRGWRGCFVMKNSVSSTCINFSATSPQHYWLLSLFYCYVKLKTMLCETSCHPFIHNKYKEKSTEIFFFKNSKETKLRDSSWCLKAGEPKKHFCYLLCPDYALAAWISYFFCNSKLRVVQNGGWWKERSPEETERVSPRFFPVYFSP